MAKLEPEAQPTPETPLATTEIQEQPVESTPTQDAQEPEETPVVMALTRPSHEKTAQETGSVIVAKALAAQLASSLNFIIAGLIDERKLAVLDELEITALNHFEYRNVVDKIRYWGYVVEGERVGSQGKDGIGRRHILTALANTSGIQAIEKAQPPNVVARNIWSRNWKEKASAAGKVVDE